MNNEFYISNRLFFLLILIFLIAPILIKYLSPYRTFVFGNMLVIIYTMFYGDGFSKINSKIFFISVFFGLYLLLQFGLIIFLFPHFLENLNCIRILGSFVLLFLNILSGWVIYKNLIKVNNKKLNSTINKILLVYSIIFFLSYLLQIFGIIAIKDMIIFNEPSHFGIFFAVVLIFIFLSYKSFLFKFFLTICILFFAFKYDNLTLVMAVIISLVLFFYSKKYGTIKMLFALGIFYLILISNLKYQEKLFYTDDLPINNPTTLAFYGGFYEALLSFSDTYTIGVGFNQSGIIKNEKNDLYIRLLEMDFDNYKDLATLTAKIINELGLIGIFLVVIYCYFFIKLIFMLSKKNYQLNELFFLSVYFSYFIQLFVRGVGYFTPLTPLFLASIFYLIFSRKHEYRS